MENITEEYPLGGLLEPFDVWREKEMLRKMEEDFEEDDEKELDWDDEDIEEAIEEDDEEKLSEMGLI